MTAVVLAGLTYLAYRSARAAFHWLHAQPQYQVAFERIELVEPPPAWYRGGNQAFLDQVRRGAGESGDVPVLDYEPNRIKIAFKKYPWVEEVTKVAFGPGSIRVWLRYRTPVAWVVPSRGQRHLIDETAALLSADDVNLDEFGQLIHITGDDRLQPPVDPRPGVRWKMKDGAAGTERDDERIVGAARLAGFFRMKTAEREPGRPGALRIVEIIVSDDSPYGLFVVNGEGAIIWWSAPPGDEQPGQPSAEEKWRLLEEWAQSTIGGRLPSRDYWAFFKDGLRAMCPHKDPTHQPKPAPSKAGKSPSPPAATAKSG